VSSLITKTQLGAQMLSHGHPQAIIGWRGSGSTEDGVIGGGLGLR